MDYSDLSALLQMGQDEYDRYACDVGDVDAETHLRLAYYRLYTAVRQANMRFCARKKRGYMAQGGTYTWSQREFTDITETLYKKYYRLGMIPKDGRNSSFNRWLVRCREYINRVSQQEKTPWTA